MNSCKKLLVVLISSLALSSCSASTGQESSLSKADACREISAIMGQWTDLSLDATDGSGQVDAEKLDALILRINELSDKTSDQELKKYLSQLASDFSLVGNEKTFFEGLTSLLADFGSPIFLEQCS